jgi:hypothetical protein
MQDPEDYNVSQRNDGAHRGNVDPAVADQTPVRSSERLRADFIRRDCAKPARRASIAGGEEREGPHRARKGQAGAVAVCIAGFRHGPALAGELFKLQTNVDMLHIPYKGAGQSIIDLVSGQIHLDFDTIPTVTGDTKGFPLRGRR